MIVKYSLREKVLMRAMKDYGYALHVHETYVQLVRCAIPGHASADVLPYRFHSVHQAAEHLVPIIKDDKYLETVCGGAQ